MANFLWGSAGQKMSPAQVAEQRKIAQALMAEGSDTSPVGHWTAALNRGLQGYLGGRQAYQAREAENAGRAGLEAKRAGQANAATFGGADPVAAALSGGAASSAAQGVSVSPVNIDGSKESFIQSLLPTALDVSEQTGVDPRIIIAQAAQETGWGRSAPNNNFFGIKSHGKGGGGTFATTEYVNGQPVTIRDSFRGYETPADSVRDYGSFLLSNPRYKPMLAASGDLDAQISALGASGYATDPNYANAIRNIATGIDLSAFGGGGAAPANSTANIAALLADEWLPDSERAVLQAQYAQQLQQQDPMYQAQLQGAQLANQAAMQPKPAAAPDTQVFFDEATGQDYRAQWNPNTMSWDRVGGVKAPSGPLVNVDMGGSPGLGKLSTDFGYVLDDAGNPKIDPATGLPQAAPVPGTPAALALEKEKEGKDKRETSSANTANIVLQDIDKAINQTGWSTAGLGGAILGALPGSGATDLRATTDTIKANIGFDRLQQMRESSPTGGALGGIAVQELAMLQAVLGSLDQAQGPEQLRANLQRLKEIYEPIAAKAAAYPNAAQFGFDGAKPPESGAATPSSQPMRLRYNPQTGAFE